MEPYGEFFKTILFFPSTLRRPPVCIELDNPFCYRKKSNIDSYTLKPIHPKSNKQVFKSLLIFPEGALTAATKRTINFYRNYQTLALTSKKSFTSHIMSGEFSEKQLETLSVPNDIFCHGLKGEILQFSFSSKNWFNHPFNHQVLQNYN